MAASSTANESNRRWLTATRSTDDDRPICKKIIGWTKMSLLLIFMGQCQTMLAKTFEGKGVVKTIQLAPVGIYSTDSLKPPFT